MTSESHNGSDEHPHVANDSDVKPEQQRRSLFVRSLPASTTTESLTELFSDSYPVKHATAVIDRSTKQCKGYGFVTFADAEDAQRARDEFNGYTLEGKKLRIEVAEPRQRDAEKAGEEGKVAVPHKWEQAAPQPSRLIVRNLPWTVKTSDDLAKLFMSYGKIKQSYIPKQRNGLLAGFGFVVLRGRKNAEKALAGVNGKEVEGRTLAVDWAVSKDVYEDLLKKGKDGELDQANGEDDDIAATSLTDGDSEPKLDGGVDFDEEEEEADDDDGDDGDESDTPKDGADDLDDFDEGESEEGEDVERSEDHSNTIFVRNLPFTCTDEDLEDHFSVFGKTRYARVVMDPATERSKGTGFVCFYNKQDADTCIRSAPRRTLPVPGKDGNDAKVAQAKTSILQNEDADPSGKYTLDGRVLQVSAAVDKTAAERLTQEGAASRRKKNDDKRRLYLLSEGTISSRSKLYQDLSITERNMREASAKQRKSLIESNPSLHLSLTRLSIRNIPRSVDSKGLKALAREAIVGFATDVKAGTRQPLSKEELTRGSEDMQAAEHARKIAGKGVVKQAKVVFEGASGSKVSEDSGAGRSRGYGFIEYHTHRNALMGLRWLNGYAVGYKAKDPAKQKAAREEIQDRKKRLIVEFAIENAQVVMRRKDNEQKARNHSLAVQRGEAEKVEPETNSKFDRSSGKHDRKRKRDESRDSGKKSKVLPAEEKPTPRQKKPVDDKLAQRNRIIGRKRAMRRARKGGKA